MKREIKEWTNNQKEKALASHFFKFLCQPTFGTFAKSHEPTPQPKLCKRVKSCQRTIDEHLSNDKLE